MFALLLFWSFSFVLLILNTVISTCHIQVLLASDYMDASSTNLIYSFVLNVRVIMYLHVYVFIRECDENNNWFLKVVFKIIEVKPFPEIPLNVTSTFII